MTMAQVEVLAVERRRRWSRSEKERLVAASFEPGVSASEVARSAGSTSASFSDGASSYASALAL
jgi:transposase